MTDAYMLLSYGGPDKPEDVLPFLRNAVAGRAVPEERLAQVGEHYFLFGGRSPINELNARLAERLRSELASRGDTRPLIVGNRNWHPFGDAALSALYRAGARTVRVLTTSAYGSYSSCRQYSEDLERWLVALGYADLRVEKVRPYWDTEGFFAAYRDAVRAALALAPAGARLVFVTHSIPTAMNDAAGLTYSLTYEEQHRRVAGRIAAELGQEWDLAFCSRSGSPHTPWLEPDINDHLRELAEAGVGHVVVAPIGFISDHMEVIYDLDTQARATAAELGIGFTRVSTIDDLPGFVRQLADLLQAPSASCDVGCCAMPARPTVPGRVPTRDSHCQP
ncbi:ferrochelatase [Trueperella pecoris]|uniref:ferrochelatase n=1 Tax=Trueperella pecoris TaxID=2733571 RepID=UPI00186B6EB9|nr:ferrochelatase [Trueperella pecoris]QOQ39678.1 ferrochelatase [Trueperella pecoris]